VKSSARYFAFGPYVLDGLRGVLWHDDALVPLTPRVVELLAALVSHANELREKDDLIREVWGGSIVEENNLARQISAIRKALGERPGQREYIATVPGVGYRFVATVTELEELPPRCLTRPPARSEHHAPEIGRDRESAHHAPADIPRPSQAWTPAVLLSTIVFLLAGGVAWIFTSRTTDGGEGLEPAQRSLRQLSYGSGVQRDPAWSPDGTRVVYAADHLGNADLWVQTIGEAEPVRLTSSPANDWQPDWSPNGDEIVFRSERDGGGLYVVPIRGGPERRLVDFGARPEWSPSGDAILFAQSETGSAASARIHVMDRDGHDPRVVRPMVQSPLTVIAAGWHPDGRISLWGRDDQGVSLFTMSRDGTNVVRSRASERLQEQIADADLVLSRFVWAPSRRFLYFEGSSQLVRNLWRVSADPASLALTGPLERLTTGTGRDHGLSISDDGRRLAFGSSVGRVGVWSFPFDPTEGRLIGPGLPVTTGEAAEHGVDASVDGRRVIYRALRSDRNELWARSENAGPRLLVSAPDWSYSQPRWSPDGTRVAYQRTRSTARGAVAERAISILAVDSQVEESLDVPDDAVIIPADWSADATTILAGCRLKPSESMGTCLVPVDGRGVRQLRHDERLDSVQHRFSPDEQWISLSEISLTDRSVAKVVVMPVSGGGPIPITDGAWYDDKPRWAPDGRTLYFVSNRGGRPDVWGRRFDSTAGRPVGDVFRVTAFDRGARTLASDVTQLAMVLARDRIFLPMQEATGHLWVLDQIDR
jgi:Tol biopolymer transport system component/DNA-binding winged helix-turn-helix (wHTH) protein